MCTCTSVFLSIYRYIGKGYIIWYMNMNLINTKKLPVLCVLFLRNWGKKVKKVARKGKGTDNVTTCTLRCKKKVEKK